jgi:hypothetical protein
MSADIECRRCHADLENYNFSEYSKIFFCPACGGKLPKKQSLELFRKTTEAEIGDTIRENVLEMLERDDVAALDAEEWSFLAWERESCDGVALYDNLKADRFCARHSEWVKDALDRLEDWHGDITKELKTLVECSDCFLVTAFIMATEHFLRDQIGVTDDEAVRTKARIAAIKRLVKVTAYDGRF